jgi:predicted TIM-barrel enzyme
MAHSVKPVIRTHKNYMSCFQQIFFHRHVILPVIHVVDEDQARRNAHLARNAGADGIFLINHDLPYGRLLEIHSDVVAEIPDWWVGVNCLDLDAVEVFRHINANISGVWVDNALIDERNDDQHKAEIVLQAQKTMDWKGLYFGGVAFKYQRDVRDIAQAAKIAVGYMDVVTTSGPGTGMAASTDKIRKMKSAIGVIPLAIASGITPENVPDYLPIADCFLVATGISTRLEELDRQLTQSLVQTIRSYDE